MRGNKEGAVTRALAEIGIAAPPADGGAKIYEELVAALNIESWIGACRAGKVGRTADCATDADVPKLKEQASLDRQIRFTGCAEISDAVPVPKPLKIIPLEVSLP